MIHYSNLLHNYNPQNDFKMFSNKSIKLYGIFYKNISIIYRTSVKFSFLHSLRNTLLMKGVSGGVWMNECKIFNKGVKHEARG